MFFNALYKITQPLHVNAVGLYMEVQRSSFGVKVVGYMGAQYQVRDMGPFYNSAALSV